MPRETFFNLPEAKRVRFVEAALAEFAAAPYDQASITQVVKRLGIAKGSVYQYFEDKWDLFSWLVAEAGRRRQEAFDALPAPPDADLFDRLALGYRRGLRAWLAEPLWSQLSLRLLEPSAEPRLVELRRRGEAQVHAFLARELAAAQAAGRVRGDLDVDSVAWLVQGMLQDGLLRAFAARLGVEREALAAAPGLPEARLARALEVADVAVSLLRAALAPPPPESAGGPSSP